MARFSVISDTDDCVHPELCEREEFGTLLLGHFVLLSLPQNLNILFLRVLDLLLLISLLVFLILFVLLYTIQIFFSAGGAANGTLNHSTLQLSQI